MSCSFSFVIPLYAAIFCFFWGGGGKAAAPNTERIYAAIGAGSLPSLCAPVCHSAGNSTNYYLLGLDSSGMTDKDYCVTAVEYP